MASVSIVIPVPPNPDGRPMLSQRTIQDCQNSIPCVGVDYSDFFDPIPRKAFVDEEFSLFAAFSIGIVFGVSPIPIRDHLPVCPIKFALVHAFSLTLRRLYRILASSFTVDHTLAGSS